MRTCDGSIGARGVPVTRRSEEHTSELQSLIRNSYAVFCLKKKNNKQKKSYNHLIKLETRRIKIHNVVKNIKAREDTYDTKNTKTQYVNKKQANTENHHITRTKNS